MEQITREKRNIDMRKGKERRNTIFPIFCGSRRLKGRLAKTAGTEVAEQIKHENFVLRCGTKVK